MYEYAVTVKRVVDGDTVDVSIDLGFEVHTLKRVRLLGINAPESRTTNKVEKQLGMAAKYRLMELVDSAAEIRLQSQGRGKFGRVLGHLFALNAEGTGWINLAEQLIAEKHGVPYDGGKR